ncbi:MAG: hypothetical protein AWM53_02090 [Candidatus Dichloromethanomonas elyunquensis]|nr:MAG: hypothetical protein AWM53_02090 [Candidatus Dichloromethanomonas elyunquensis]
MSELSAGTNKFYAQYRRYPGPLASVNRFYKIKCINICCQNKVKSRHSVRPPGNIKGIQHCIPVSCTIAVQVQ